MIEALSLDALLGCGTPEAEGRVLLKKAFTLEQMGNVRRAVTTLQEAALRIDADREPRQRTVCYSTSPCSSATWEVRRSGGAVARAASADHRAGEPDGSGAPPLSRVPNPGRPGRPAPGRGGCPGRRRHSLDVGRPAIPREGPQAAVGRRPGVFRLLRRPPSATGRRSPRTSGASR